jgi:hypothetical protein
MGICDWELGIGHIYDRYICIILYSIFSYRLGLHSSNNLLHLLDLIDVAVVIVIIIEGPHPQHVPDPCHTQRYVSTCARQRDLRSVVADPGDAFSLFTSTAVSIRYSGS